MFVPNDLTDVMSGGGVGRQVLVEKSQWEEPWAMTLLYLTLYCNLQCIVEQYTVTVLVRITIDE